MPDPTRTYQAVEPHAALLAYEERLPVRLISTPRSAFSACQPDDPLSDVITRSRDEGFDFVPVVERREGQDAPIIGLLHAAAIQANRLPSDTVRDYMEPLSEKHLLGADASILDFVQRADTQPFALVLAGREVTGLGSISDLQRLPVRAALFAMVTHLEMVMADTIRRKLPDAEKWMPLLSPHERKSVLEQIKRAKQRDSFIDPVLYTTFMHKATIVERMDGPAATDRQARHERDSGPSQQYRPCT